MEKIKQLIPREVFKLKHKLVSVFFSAYYSNPSRSMTVIGVTGTDGKTTTSTLIYEILKEAGHNAGLITTISAKIGDKDYPTGFHVTNPNPRHLQKFLKKMKEMGAEYVVLETTSHGLDQYRVDGIRFTVAVYTNITREHLDYHQTFQNYLSAKLKLIDLTKPDGLVIVNRDSEEIYEAISQRARNRKLATFSYGIENSADLIATNIGLTEEESNFSATTSEKKFKVNLKRPGQYNIYNSLAAIGTALYLGISAEVIASALSKTKRLEGRWEIVQTEPFKIIIDFAHTPNALWQMLSHASKQKENGRVIVVFGSASKRDAGKRPLMGEAAGQFADLTFLTAEDPRGESVAEINKQIAQGLIKKGKLEGKHYFSIEDRRQAIDKAINIAKAGDTVIISGKGHEKSMNLDGKSEIPWSDIDVVNEILNNKRQL